MTMYQSSDEAIEAAVQRREPDLTPYFRLQWEWHRERVAAAVAEHFPVDIPEPTYTRALVNWVQASQSQRDEWLPGTLHSYIEFLLEELIDGHPADDQILPDPDGDAEAAQEQAEEARLEAQHQRDLLREFQQAGRLSIVVVR